MSMQDLDRQLEPSLAHHAQILVGQISGLPAGSYPFELIDQSLQPL